MRLCIEISIVYVYLLEVMATDLYNFHANSIITPHSTEYYLNGHYDMQVCIIIYSIHGHQTALYNTLHNALPRSTSIVFNSDYCALVVQNVAVQHCIRVSHVFRLRPKRRTAVTQACRFPLKSGLDYLYLISVKKLCSTLLLLYGGPNIPLCDMCILYQSRSELRNPTYSDRHAFIFGVLYGSTYYNNIYIFLLFIDLKHLQLWPLAFCRGATVD